MFSQRWFAVSMGPVIAMLVVFGLMDLILLQFLGPGIWTVAIINYDRKHPRFHRWARGYWGQKTL